MHGYAIARDHEGATTFLKAMECGDSEIRPGSSCYGGFIFSCVRSRKWGEAMSCYDKAKGEGIILGPSAIHGLILSAQRNGGRPAVQQILNDVLETGSSVNRETCLLVLRIFIPELKTDQHRTLTDTRKQLRTLSDKGIINEEYALDLLRGLRAAELAGERPTSSVHKEKIQNEAWLSVLGSILGSSSSPGGDDAAALSHDTDS